MFWKYGNYRHTENEVDLSSFTIQKMYSQRNTCAFTRKTLTMLGHLCVSGQSAIKAAIEEIESAYRLASGGSNGGQEGWTLNAGLYHDDGTPSPHFLDASESVNGVRLISLNWGKEDGAEYASGRSYSIVMQSEELNVEDPIYSFSESVQFIGNCGPRWELVPCAIGPPITAWIHEQTPQRIIQSGTAVGIQAPPYIPAELLPWEYKHGDESFWEHGSPEMIGRNANLLFPARWRYVFSSVSKLDFYPHPDYPGH